MNAPRYRQHLVVSFLLANVALFVGGCTKDEGAVVNFPESNMQPTVSEGTSGEGNTGTTSQGDPSQYSR
jgi:hypothetical protein